MSDARAAPGRSLWRHGDFLKLWAAQSVSSVGARITREGLPFAAVMSLGASPTQVGILAALSRGPAILVGFVAGGPVDRRRRRPIMILADLGRALALATIPIAAWSRLLTMAQIDIVAALVGTLSVLFEIADHAYLPSLVAPDQIVEANARLSATDGIAEIGGPALYGVLFQWLTAPIAILVNAGTYVFSAAALGLIGHIEPRPSSGDEPPAHPFSDALAGLRLVLADPNLAPMLAMETLKALFGAFFSALYILWAVRGLGLSAAMLGTTVATGGIAALAGAAAAPWLIRRLAIGRAYVIFGVGATASTVFIPLAGGSPAQGMLMLIIAQLLGDSIGTVEEIAGRGLRQTLVAPDFLGRVGGIFAMAPGAAGLIGAVTGGWLGVTLGPRPALFIASGGLILAAAIGLASPLMRRTVAAA